MTGKHGHISFRCQQGRHGELLVIAPPRPLVRIIIGQKDIVDSCPYGAIWWNEEKSVAQKCSFCAHLLDNGWKEPRCVQACPTGSMRLVHAEDSEMQKIIGSENLEVLHPEHVL